MYATRRLLTHFLSEIQLCAANLPLSPTPSVLSASLLSGPQEPCLFIYLPFLPGKSFTGILSVSGLETKIHNDHQVSIRVRSHWPLYILEQGYQVSSPLPSTSKSYFQIPLQFHALYESLLLLYLYQFHLLPIRL